jgi:hypothetical protein
MAGSYIATPNSSNAIVEVATGTAVKTVLQVATPSTTGIIVLGWGISFDGISSTAEPIPCALIDVDVAATVTSLTPAKYGDDNDEASLCVGGVSATGYNGSAEGTITASRILDAQEVHPQSGYGVWFPSLQQRVPPRVKVSKFLRIRTTAPAGVNCIPWIVWDE